MKKHSTNTQQLSADAPTVAIEGAYQQISGIYWEIFDDDTIQFGGMDPRVYWENLFIPTTVSINLS
ncbi:hypothetical protein FACS1894132_12300 [Clostridia bacterium]|nr:hypothetical protein FACS1894132_12300 [Clostridia bacterium]